MLWLYQNGNNELRILFESDLLVACKESCISQRQQCKKVGVGTMPNARKNLYLVLGFYVQDWHWMGSLFNSFPCDLVLL
jgi:hypothetical protein